MESLGKILEKMEAPLSFAAGDSFDRISLVKNLEAVMTSLARQLQDGINREAPETQKGELERIAVALLNLFDGYDSLLTELKRDRLAEAIHHLSVLKSIQQNLPAGEGGGLSAPEEEGSALNFLSLPVQSVRGVGPRVAELLTRKNLSTVEDLLYFLPRRYDDRRTVCRISETVPGLSLIHI